MSLDEWDDIRIKIESDQELLSLKIQNLYYDSVTGEQNICLVDTTTNDAYAIYRGTGGGEWLDDFEGGYLPDTKQQQKALLWLDSLPKFHSLTVSGHSKGANKAQYVTYLADKVDNCVSFDGQGFSAEFIEKYWAEIRLNKDKITAYALKSDFVNILLYYIDLGQKRIYIKANPSYVDHFVENHSPNALLTKINIKGTNFDFILVKADHQNSTMKYLHEFTIYIMNAAPISEKKLMLDYLGNCVATFFESGSNTDKALEYATKTEHLEGLILVVSYMIKYAQVSGLDGKTVTNMLATFHINLDIPDGMVTIARQGSGIITSDDLIGDVSRFGIGKALDIAQPLSVLYEFLDKKEYDNTIGKMVAMGISTTEAEKIINGILNKTSKLKANMNDFKEAEIKPGKMQKQLYI